MSHRFRVRVAELAVDSSTNKNSMRTYRIHQLPTNSIPGTMMWCSHHMSAKRPWKEAQNALPSLDFSIPSYQIRKVVNLGGELPNQGTVIGGTHVCRMWR